MALLVWILGAVDVLLTDYGMRLGVVREGNPLMASLFAKDPGLAVVFSLIFSGVMLVFLHHLREKCCLAARGLLVLLVVRIFIIMLHINWLTQITW